MNEQTRRLADALREIIDLDYTKENPHGAAFKALAIANPALAAYDAQPDAEDVAGLRAELDTTTRYLQARIKELEEERNTLRARIAELEATIKQSLIVESAWVPVGERLPDNNRDVLIWDGAPGIAWRRDSGIWMCENAIGNITHWRELPNPPKL